MTPAVRVLTGLALMSGLLAASEGGAQTIWRCEDRSGTAIYTDRPQTRKDCEIYQLQAKTQMLTKRRDAEVRLTLPMDAGGETPRTQTKREESPPVGVLSFGALNRLSVGMTEAEVANLAGSPKSKNIDSWVYRASDDSVVELRFGSGRVVEIKQYPPAQ